MLGTLVKMHCLSFYKIICIYIYVFQCFIFFATFFHMFSGFFQVFSSTPAVELCGTVQAALGGAPGLGHLAVSDFAIDEVATLLWEENDPRRKQEARFFQQNDPAFDGKIPRKIYGNTFFQLFFGCF